MNEEKKREGRGEAGAASPSLGDDIRGLIRQELNVLGINVDSGANWTGQPIVASQTLVLSAAQKAWAIVLGGTAFVAFLATFAQGWVAAFTWMCQVGWIHTWCPLPVTP